MKKTNLKRINTKMPEDGQNQLSTPRPSILDGDAFDQLPRLPGLNIDQTTTLNNLRENSSELSWQEHGVYGLSMNEAPKTILSASHVDHVVNMEIETEKVATVSTEGQVAVLRRLVKSSGFYAISSMALPLISLVLSPFLTHNLLPSDYGILTILNTAISLAAGITQLGLASAFFRAYCYDYTSEHDRRDVVAVATALLCLVSIPTVILVAVTSPFLAKILLGQSSLGGFVSLAGGVVLMQNLTVPGLAWLRAENRPLFYSLLSISGMLITLFANVVLVGVLHWGVAGSVIAMGSGYACIFICTMPIIILHAGIRIRVDIARNLLAFGLPLILNYISYWVLQFSDRYLLSLFTSLTETARYAVPYTLGSAMAVLVIGPFTLAWPTTMFAIARRKDAVQGFMLVFRWFSMFLLFAAFGLSLVGTFLLDWLFPVTYHSAVLIIPIVAESIAFYGIYFVFMVGANLKRKTWLTAVFTTTAALVNFVVNLILIPRYGAMGAASSTLIAYIVLAFAAYIVNQRIYPIPFEIGRFFVALFVGVALYIGSSFLALSQGTYVAWSIHVGALALYAGCLAFLGKFPSWSQSLDRKNGYKQEDIVL